MEDLLFLHLLNNRKERDRYFVSQIITQSGIQNALGCDISLISRLLRKNEEKGYIFRVLSKVEDKKRKQNAFFLGEDGIKIALEISKMNNNPKINSKNNIYFESKIASEF